MTGTRDEQLNDLNRTEMICQWLLAAVTNDGDMLGELQDATEQCCSCCTAVVTRALAQLAASLSVQLHGQAGAEHCAEQLLGRCLDDITELENSTTDP
jgi:hypothetical protein